ncbi:hypothetical protein [Bacillus cereus]|uniref:hypothetical protein n=1 Tax=Bacillus cereus TaxID=1396 RepID=UPI000A42C2EC
MFIDEQVRRAKQNGVSREILWDRVKRRRQKWDIEVAINTPVLTPAQAASRAYQAGPFSFKGTQEFWNKKRA